MAKKSVSLAFDDNYLLSQLLGERDENLTCIENHYKIPISCRGEIVSLTGDDGAVVAASTVLERLYENLKNGNNISLSDVKALIRIVDSKAEQGALYPNGHESGDGIIFKTLKKPISPYTSMQLAYMRCLAENELVFATGPAGTGKTYVAVAAAVTLFIENKIDRIILSRPAVEAGERLGFLPGDMQEKVDPYLRPLYDALNDMMPAEKILKYIRSGQIEIAPLAFMRGRTLSNAAVILDEAQNATPVQMKMFLTRLGEGSRMFVTGDLSQTDLPKGQRSGLRDAISKLSDIEEIKVLRFHESDSVRHKLTTKIIHAYKKHDDEDKWKDK